MTTIYGFELLREEHIAELNTNARVFRHVRTGAELLSLENDDENKVFGITFRTPPTDSTGVAHILEHVVLAGSRKYRVKEPFVELLKGSLQTFVNAFTYPDRTCYPVASQNLQDFYNLIDVYLDAVFYPLLSPYTFRQEGWRYELEAADQPLTYQGVVFNEMKGNYSDPDDMLDDAARRSLFPDTSYGLDSGGDPRHIPDLTHEQFVAFHNSYYHPSNPRIYMWGDDPADARLQMLDKWLGEFEPLDVDSSVPVQPPFTEPRHIEKPYAAGEDSKTYLVVNWALAASADPELDLGLGLLSHILVGPESAPLRRALIDSGLGEDLAGFGMMGELRQMVFSTGLKGIDPENLDAVEALIDDTLAGLVQQGIDPRTVESAMNTIEFHLRERNTGGFPRGLAVMLSVLSNWVYDEDPLTLLAFEAPLQSIKARLAAGERYFESLIEQHFLQNPHRTTLILRPDDDVQAEQEAEESARLAAAKATMSAADIERLLTEMAELHRIQERPDDPAALAAIPRLGLDDLERTNKLIPSSELTHADSPILYHDLFTNGVTYLDVGLNLRGVPAALLPYVPLFSRALQDMGTEQEDFVSLSQRIGAKTGGIRSSLFTSSVRATGDPLAWLFLRGKAMAAQTGDLLDIFSDILLSTRFDNRERFRQIVLEEKAGAESSLLPAGHAVVNGRLRAQFDVSGWAAEQMQGIDHLFFLRKLLVQIEQDWPAVLAALHELRATFVNRQSMLFNVTLDADNWAQVQPQLAQFIDTLPGADVIPAAWPVPSPVADEGLTIPAQVNYVGKAANLYDLGYMLHGSHHVITRYLRTSWLWERVRMMGGAYGVMCLFDSRSGVFSYVSYRDPNLAETLSSYDGTAAFLRQLDLSEDDLTRTIIGAIGALDAHMLPDAKGFVALQRHLLQEDDAFRQQTRDEIMGTTVADFRAFAEVLAGMNETGRVAVLGSTADIEQANASGAVGLAMTKVL